MEHPILIAVSFSIFSFLLSWYWSIRNDFYSLVDATWAIGFAFVASIYFFAGDRSFSQAIYLTMVWIWSLRLGVHLFVRLFKHFPKEDIRYDHLRQDFRSNVKGKFLLFHGVQAFTQIVLSIPFGLYLFFGPVEEWTWNALLGFALFPLAVIGEATADRQLKRFKSDPRNQGKVCSVGLWNYSRHPNYFFEFLIWVAFALPACSAPWGPIALLSPVMMLFLLLKISGVPLNEELSIRSKGQAYRDYMKTTRMFVPLPKRKT